MNKYDPPSPGQTTKRVTVERYSPSKAHRKNLIRKMLIDGKSKDDVRKHFEYLNSIKYNATGSGWGRYDPSNKYVTGSANIQIQMPPLDHNKLDGDGRAIMHTDKIPDPKKAKLLRALGFHHETSEAGVMARKIGTTIDYAKKRGLNDSRVLAERIGDTNIGTHASPEVLLRESDKIRNVPYKDVKYAYKSLRGDVQRAPSHFKLRGNAKNTPTNFFHKEPELSESETLSVLSSLWNKNNPFVYGKTKSNEDSAMKMDRVLRNINVRNGKYVGPPIKDQHEYSLYGTKRRK